jgi:RNA polymerase sigma factor (sigma-70 family)
MRNGPADNLVRQLCARVAADAPGVLPDRELVAGFAAGRDERAFEALVRRHGPMVLRVCRRVLGNDHDAEDAFQATFLVLARRAQTLRHRESVGSWLYGVAYRVSLRARSDAARRRAREARAAVPSVADPLAELTVREAQTAFDEELARLPERLRAPLVLCCLEGLTRDEAARGLGCSPTTLKGRLEKARGLLRGRLVRRGLTLPAGLLASLLAEGVAQAGVPAAFLPPVVGAALRYAAGGAPPTGAGTAAASLADGFLRAGAARRWAVATGLLLLLGVAGGGAALVARHNWGAAPAEPAVAPAADVPKEPPRPGPEARPGPVAEAVAPAEWPQWRGPNRDGVVHGVTVPAKWPRALTEEWRAPVGEGAASPVVVGGSVYVFTREKADEVVRCLDLAGGKEIWRSEPYPAPYVRGGGEGEFSIGPRSTPAVADGRVFTFGVTGVLSCLDARTGTLLWRKDCKPCPPYGGSSPLVADGLCIVHYGDGKTGGLTAFDAATGDVRWCYTDGSGPTSASPILVTLAGERQVVTFTTTHLLGVSAATGKRLWQHGPFGAGTKIVTPVRHRDLLIVADNMAPPRALRLERGDQGITATEVWKAKGLPLNMSTPVLAGDLLFGMSDRARRCFFCLDANTGTTLWESDDGEDPGNTSILNAGSVLLFLTAGGRLVVVRPSGTAYEPVADYRMSDTQTWAHPVFLGDRIVIKDAATLRLFRIEQDTGER